MKTLGEIAYESAFEDVQPRLAFAELPESSVKRWEAAGENVKQAAFDSVSAWVQRGETLFAGPQRWSLMFQVGAWWADRPWRKP